MMRLTMMLMLVMMILDDVDDHDDDADDDATALIYARWSVNTSTVLQVGYALCALRYASRCNGWCTVKPLTVCAHVCVTVAMLQIHLGSHQQRQTRQLQIADGVSTFAPRQTFTQRTQCHW